MDANLISVARKRLPQEASELARTLIGYHLVRNIDGERLVGRIVETEAYLSDDEASHSFKGQTARNGAMFLRRGHAYVYRIYGLYWCLNVSAGAAGEGAAVLIRAVEPLDGLEVMASRRAGASMRDLARGPGRLTAAFAIDCSLDGIDLCEQGPLWLAEGRAQAPIGQSMRVGITRAAEAPLRFFERGNAHVSGPKSLNA